MSRRMRIAVVALFAVALVVCLVVLALGQPDRSASAPSTVVAAGTVPGGPLPPEPQSARCRAMKIAYFPDLRRRGAHFADLVRASPGNGDVKAVGSALLFLRSSLQPDYGSWGPAVDYLSASARHTVLGKGEQPTLNDDIVASAERIDRDLAAHVCG